MTSLGYALVWWLVSSVLAFLSLPLATKVFKFLPDKGIGFARVLGLMLSAYLAWILGFAFNSVATSALAVAGLAGLSYWIFSKDVRGFKELWEEHKGLLMVYEALFLGLFLLWAMVRMYNPDILNTEKFMDFAFFNALQRDTRFPPYDPWLAAPKNYLNYYYFGYFAMAHFARLTFLNPDVCYNLVIAFVFGLSGQAVFSIGYNTTRVLWPGFVGVGLLQVFGNLHGGLQVLRNGSLDIDWWAPTRLIKDVSKMGAKGAEYVNHWWWSAGPEVLRANGLNEGAAKDGLISEFPVFSFLHGDMHPHFTAIPFVLLALALGLNLVKNEDRDPLNAFEASSARNSRLLSLGLLILAMGVVFMTNTWDVPAYGLSLSVLLLAQQHYQGRLDKQHWLKSWLLPSAALLGGLVLASLPFILFFKNPASEGFGYSRAKTGMHDTLIFWGGFLVVIVPFLFLRVRAWAKALVGEVEIQAASAPKKVEKSPAGKCVECGSRLRAGKPFCPQCGHKNDPETRAAASLLSAAPSETFEVDASGTPALAAAFLKIFARPGEALRERGIAIAAWSVVILWVAAIVFVPTTGVFLGLALLCALLIASRQDRPEALFALSLILVGSLMVVLVEWAFLKDVFKDNPSLTRMNTTFKFYFQAWILFAAASPFALYWSVQALGRLAADLARPVYLAVLGIVFFLAALYPLGAFKMVSGNFLRDSNLSPTLDGGAWLKRDYPGDYDMIQWMRKHIEGKAVVAEAVGGAYSKFARVASYTGLAAVVGWGNHESQWRQKWPTQEEADMNRLFETLDMSEAQSLVKKYGVQYVYCGALERSKYNPDQLNKFAAFMEKVPYSAAGTTVFKAR